MAETMRSEADGKHPASHYLVVPDPQKPSTWALRYRDVNGNVDHRLMGACWAALTVGYRGNKYQGPNKAAAMAKLKQIYESEGMPTPAEQKAAGEDELTPLEALLFVEELRHAAEGAFEAFVNRADNKDLDMDDFAAWCLKNNAMKVSNVADLDDLPTVELERLAKTFRAAGRPDEGSQQQQKPPVGGAEFQQPGTPDTSGVPIGSATGGDGQPAPANSAARTTYLEKLLQLLRDFFTGGRTALTQADLSDIMASARGHAGGKTSPKAGADEPLDWPDRWLQHPSLHSDTGTPFYLFVELAGREKAPGGREWIPFIAKPGRYKHARYGDINLSRERVARFVSQFNAGTYQKPVALNAEHMPAHSGAFGWIHELRQNHDGTADALVEWTPRGKEAVDNGEFRFVSAEWHDLWTDNKGQEHKDIVIGGALTVRPYFKPSDLRPLVASGEGLYVYGEDDPQRPAVAIPQAQEGSTMPDQKHLGTSGAADPKPGGDAQLTEEQKRFSDMEAAKNAAEAALAAAQRELAEAKKSSDEQAEQARVAVERANELWRRDQLRTFAEQAADWPVEAPKAAELMLTFSEEQMTGFTELMTEAERQIKAARAQINTASLFSSMGAGDAPNDGSPEAELRARIADVRQAKPALSEAQAYAEAFEGLTLDQRTALYAGQS